MKSSNNKTTLILLAITISMSLVSLQETKIWKTEYLLWLNTVTLSPHGAKANNNFANVLFKEHKTKEAIPYYKRAIESLPNYKDAHYNLATSYLKTGRFKESISVYKTFLTLDPNSIDGNFNLAFSYTRVGDLDNSILQFQKVLKLDPNNREAQGNLNKLLEVKYGK